MEFAEDRYRRFASRAAALAAPVLAKGCAAAIGQPSPAAAFVLAVMVELARLLHAMAQKRGEVP